MKTGIRTIPQLPRGGSWNSKKAGTISGQQGPTPRCCYVLVAYDARKIESRTRTNPIRGPCRSESGVSGSGRLRKKRTSERDRPKTERHPHCPGTWDELAAFSIFGEDEPITAPG